MLTMRNYITLLLVLFLFSCVDYGPSNRYTQLTSDDLSYLYYNFDTLTYSGQTILYVDTITFLVNGVNRIKVPVKTKIQSTPSMFFPDLPESIDGVSEMRPANGIDIRYAEVINSKSNDDFNSEKWFYFYLNNGQSFSKVFYSKDSIKFDTANVLGRQYVDVIKFKPDSLTQGSMKSLYFAKKFGFIKIETFDGLRIERELPNNL